MYQILIKNASIIDPAGQCHEEADLAVEDGRILGIGHFQGEARQVINASGCLVTPGLIDHHCHIYPMARIGIPAESVCFASGVTTAVDAGSTGCRTFREYLPFMENSKLRIKAYVNLCSNGLASLPEKPEDLDPAHFEEEELKRLLEEQKDKICGLKLRTSRQIVGDKAYAPLEAGAALARRLGTSLMVHCTDPPGSMETLLSFLDEGDVLTHMYMNKGSTLLDEKGKVLPAARKARSRGVLFEAADARAHFSFAVSEAAVKEGFFPDFIATDLTKFSMHLRPTAFDLANQAAKYAQLGIPLEQVIRALSLAPAKALGLEEETGSLTPGSCADIAVFRKEESSIKFGDRPYDDPECVLRPCQWRFRTMLTLRAGEMVYRDPAI